ncbi:MAG: TlpA disulfide reductase family protein [Pseudomonadota bacterium]
MRNFGRLVFCRLLPAALLGLVVLGCAASAGSSRGGTVGKASDFALKDVEGQTVRLSDFQGKVVLVNFWATWCVPCAGELPHLQRLYDSYRDHGLVVLGISMDDPRTVANVAPQVRRYGLTFPVLLDEETRVVGVYNPKLAAPYAVLIGRNGAIAATREGYSPGDEVALEEQIKALLGASAGGSAGQGSASGSHPASGQ